MSREITINDRRIGPGQPAYVIAELSANHNQDFDQAVRSVQAADGSVLKQALPSFGTTTREADYVALERALRRRS